MSFHDVHSCIQLAADNDKLKSLIKKLKRENDALRQRMQNLEDVKRVEDLMKRCGTTRNMEVQTEPRGYSAYQPSAIAQQLRQKKIQEAKNTDPDKLNKMLIMHNGLMKRYEKELRVNVDHVETITKLNLRINEVEVKLKQSEMEIHELKIGKQMTKAKKRSRSAGVLKHRPRAMDVGSDSEVSDLIEEFHKVKKERDKLAKDKKKLQTEVKGLDRCFFEEVEDLKYALQQSAKLNKQYEKALRKLCSKFGYPFPFPEDCTAKV